MTYKSRRIELKYVPTDFLIAYVLTKAADPNKFKIFQENDLSDQHILVKSVVMEKESCDQSEECKCMIGKNKDKKKVNHSG